ncbi:MAG: hypothetical protein IJ165_03435 [Proteobacteria bacterium]|nr:hypothetical protein [Pseudomonadota bacterium]
MITSLDDNISNIQASASKHAVTVPSRNISDCSELATTHNRHLTIVFILICTERLGNAYVGQMFTAVEEFIEEIRRFAKKQEINVSIDTLINAEEVYWQTDKAVPLDEYEWHAPNAGGTFKPPKVFSILNNRLVNYAHDEYFPIIYLFSGKLYPKLNCKEYQDLIKLSIYQQAVRNSVSLKVITTFLEAFATSPEHILSDFTPENLKKSLTLKQNQNIFDAAECMTVTTSNVFDDAIQKIKNLENLYEDSKTQYLELYKEYQVVSAELQTIKNNSITQSDELQKKLDAAYSERDNAIANSHALIAQTQVRHKKLKLLTIASGVIASCFMINQLNMSSNHAVQLAELKSSHQMQLAEVQKQRDELSAQLSALLPEGSKDKKVCYSNSIDIEKTLKTAHGVIYEQIKQKNPKIYGELIGKLIIENDTVSWAVIRNKLYSKVSPSWLTQIIENNYEYPSNCTGSPVEVTWTFKY